LRPQLARLVHPFVEERAAEMRRRGHHWRKNAEESALDVGDMMRWSKE